MLWRKTDLLKSMIALGGRIKWFRWPDVPHPSWSLKTDVNYFVVEETIKYVKYGDENIDGVGMPEGDPESVYLSLWQTQYVASETSSRNSFHSSSLPQLRADHPVYGWGKTQDQGVHSSPSPIQFRKKNQTITHLKWHRQISLNSVDWVFHSPHRDYI